MISHWIIKTIEKIFSRKSPLPFENYNPKIIQKPDIDKVIVAVIGTGIAGTVFTRQLLMLARKENIDIKIIQIGHPSCNYCGGLMTHLAETTLKNLLNLDTPVNVELSRINECIFINSHGGFEVSTNVPLISMLRTSKFGEQGFDDELKNEVLEGLDEKTANSLFVIEPATVFKIILPDPKTSTKAKIFYIINRENKEIEADMVVLATGLRTLGTNMLGKFSEDTGYTAPGMIDSSVTEIDTSNANYDYLEHRAVIIDKIIKDCVVGIVSKRKGWLTVTSLNKVLTVKDLENIFFHQSIKKYIDLPNVVGNLRCKIICEAKVFTAPAKNFYGDGWVIIGDLTGYGRVLKDGYFAALFGAYHAANTIIYHGVSKKAFEKHYHKELKRFEFDNRIGMGLFNLNNKLEQINLFSKFFINAGIYEQKKEPYGNFIHSGIRAIVTGELSYKIISLLFFFGLIKYLLTYSIKFLSNSKR